MTIKRIIEVTRNYSIRHFFKDKNFTKPFIYDMSTLKMCRITSDIPDENISSILFCDFDEQNSVGYETVRWFKEHINELITDKKIPVKNFKFWYGIEEGKFICGELNALNENMIVMPVRNLKHIVNKPFNKLFVKNGLLYLSNEEGIITELPYEQNGNNLGKCILIGKNGKSLFVYGVRCTNKEEIEKINKYLKENPSYPIMVDNGRYLFYFIGDDIKKHAFVCGGFSEIDDLYIYGSTK
jgi:hypothetical protein